MLLDVLKFLGIMLLIGLVALFIITREAVYTSAPFSKFIASKVAFSTTKIQSGSGNIQYTANTTILNKGGKEKTVTYSGDKSFRFLSKNFILDLKDNLDDNHHYVLSDKAGYFLDYYYADAEKKKPKNQFEYNPYTNVTHLGCNNYDYLLLQFLKYYVNGNPISSRLCSDVTYKGIKKLNDDKCHVIECKISNKLEKYLVGYKSNFVDSGTISYYADLTTFEIQKIVINCNTDVATDDNNIFIESKKQLKGNKSLVVDHYQIDYQINFDNVGNTINSISVPQDLLNTKVKYSKFSNPDCIISNRKALLEDSYTIIVHVGLLVISLERQNIMQR